MLNIAWEKAMSSIMEAQEDIKELVSKWKEMLNTIPHDVEFRFFDGQVYKIPNFAKLMKLMLKPSVTPEPNTLVLRNDQGDIFSNKINGDSLVIEPIGASHQTERIDLTATTGLRIYHTQQPSQAELSRQQLQFIHSSTVTSGLSQDRVWGHQWELSARGLSVDGRVTTTLISTLTQGDEALVLNGSTLTHILNPNQVSILQNPYNPPSEYINPTIAIGIPQIPSNKDPLIHNITMINSVGTAQDLLRDNEGRFAGFEMTIQLTHRGIIIAPEMKNHLLDSNNIVKETVRFVITISYAV
jgi:hypothetical protein